MKLKISKQKTCEGCLSVCLMNLLEQQKNIKLNEELKILTEGLKFTRLDFSTGHLVYLCKKFPQISLEQYIDFHSFQKTLNKLKLPKNLKLHPKKIDLKFLKEITKTTPIMCYIDFYTLDKNYHYPHFIILSEINNNTSIIHDPWYGKKFTLDTKTLVKSISSLRNKLKISPKVIRII